MKMKRLIFLCILIIILAVTVSGCSIFEDIDVEDEAENSQSIDADTDSLIRVGFSQLGSESMWRAANTESVRNALTEANGFTLEFNNAKQRQENQIKAIRSFISQRVDYIVFSPVTEEGWETVLGEAKDAGIPVILMDRTISTKDSTLYTSWIGSNTRREGEKAGEWLEDYLKANKMDAKEINIVVLQGTQGSSAQLGRTMGFDSVKERHDNWTILSQEVADFTTAKGAEVMKKFIARYEKIDVVVCQNDDMAFGAISAMNEAGIDTSENGVIIISFDAVKEALYLVQKGVINADIECNPLQGEYIADTIRKLEAGESVERSYEVSEQVFTKENVNDYIDSRMY